VNVNLTSWGPEKREEYWIHFELLRNTTVDWIIAIDTNLIDGIISEVESDSGMSGRPSDVNKDFANDLIRIDTDRVESKWARRWEVVMGRGRHITRWEVTAFGGLYNTFSELWEDGVVRGHRTCTIKAKSKKLALTRFELARFPITDWTEPKRDAITTRPQYRKRESKGEQ
jgi:hypothetical protein